LKAFSLHPRTADPMTEDPVEDRERMHRRADRLPPPAFPPGNRRDWLHQPRSTDAQHDGGSGHGGIPDEAFYTPRDSIRRISTLGPAGGQGKEPDAGTTISLAETELSYEDVALILEELAREIRGYQGGRFLWKPGVSPLEGALRGLLSGYLRLGRREGEEGEQS